MFSMFKGLALGAGMMYLFDPEHGGRRRGEVRDRLADAGGALESWFDDALHDPMAHTPALAAAAAGGVLGLKLLGRMPLATLALGAVGLAVAAQNGYLASTGGQGRILMPGDFSRSDPSRHYDSEELSHYGASGQGYSGGARRNEGESVEGRPSISSTGRVPLDPGESI